ncbi:hypothetical protein [Synechococcus sp. PCC 7336]|uniref:hypothetical protein n=1 Tax=Synechococcus sp. PCC 7336 TaxID=195250 RepID=UPI00034D73AC|nr:hypothetical protein [Synechococcus sp. PCC 7336]
MDNAAIEAMLDAYFTHLSAMQPGDWIEVFAEDAVLRDPVNTRSTGKTAMFHGASYALRKPVALTSLSVRSGTFFGGSA